MEYENENVPLFHADMLIGDIKVILLSMVNSIDFYFNHRSMSHGKGFNEFVRKEEAGLISSLSYNIESMEGALKSISIIREKEKEEAKRSNVVKGPWSGLRNIE